MSAATIATLRLFHPLKVMLLVLLLLSCYDLPTNPDNPANSDVSLSLKSEAGLISEQMVSDTTGNDVEIIVTLRYPQYIQKVILQVLASNDSIVDDTTLFPMSRKYLDTIRLVNTFSMAGEKRVVATAIVEGNSPKSDTARMTIVNRTIVQQQILNHKPELLVNGNNLITADQTCSLSVVVNDSDAQQVHTINVWNKGKSTVVDKNIYTWTPVPEFIGKDTLIFIVTDYGVPVLSDTVTVVVEVNAHNPAVVKPSITIDTNGTNVGKGDTVSTDSATITVIGNRAESRFRARIDTSVWSQWQLSGMFTYDSLTVGYHAVTIESKYEGGDSVVTESIAFFVRSPKSTAKTFASFDFTSLNAKGTITESARTIAVIVPYETNVTALVATFVATGVSVKVGSKAQVSDTTPNDFTKPVIYRVTAADSSYLDYTVTVEVGSNTSKAISAFSFINSTATTIDTLAKTIIVNVPFSTAVNALVPTISHSGASISPAGGVAQNFTNGVTYTVTAADKSTQNYTVTVKVGQDSTKAPSTIVFANGATVTKQIGSGAYTNTVTGDGTGTISYTSGTQGVATVNLTTGEVTLGAVGITIITATKTATSTHAAVAATYTLTVTALAPSTIVFTDVGVVTKQFGSGAYTNHVSGEGTGVISYTSETPGVATVNPTTGEVRLVAVGTTTVTAFKAVTSTHAAVSAVYTLTVTKGTPSITTPPAATSIIYGQQYAASTVTGAGSVPGVFTFTTPATISNAGTISAAAVQFNPTDSPNYSNVTGLTVSLVIAKKALTVTAENKSKVFAATPLPDPPLTTTITGFVNGENVSALGGALVVNRATGVDAGTYPITASGYTSDNYNITYVAGVFTITGGQPQTITFGSLPNKTYGDADFSLTAQASSNLTVSYVSSNTAVATITGSTLKMVGSGEVSITAQQSGNANFAAATPATQSLTVAKKSLTITGLSVSPKVYDGNTTASITGTAALSGIITGDDVTVTGSPTATFATAAAGIGKSVTISGYTLGGTASGKYTLPTGLTGTINKATPIITNPTASSIVFGQVLSSATLTGGSATASGTFAFNTPGAIPPLGTASYSVTFTPTDNTNYNTTSVTVSVTVNLPRVTDGDGITYESVLIGNQIWMKENLRTTSYIGGTQIPNVTDNTAWGALKTQGYCYYDNTSNPDSIKKYGALYNWYTVNTKELVPTGWHVPTDEDWYTLANTLGGASAAGGKLKAITGWASPNTATDSSGFSALPGSSRSSNGTFSNMSNYRNQCNYGYWWSATENSSSLARYRYLFSGYGTLGTGTEYKSCGFSIRLIRD